MVWNRVTTVIADFLILRDDSVARLAASHTLIKAEDAVVRLSPFRTVYVCFGSFRTSRTQREQYCDGLSTRHTKNRFHQGLLAQLDDCHAASEALL